MDPVSHDLLTYPGLGLQPVRAEDYRSSNKGIVNYALYNQFFVNCSMSPKGDAGLNGAVNCEIVYFRGKNKGRKNKGASLRASQKILGTT